MIKVTWWEKLSISGKVTDQRIYVRLDSHSQMQATRSPSGSWMFKAGDCSLQHLFKKWCAAEFGEELPPFDTIMERLKALKPKSVNPKTPAWLR